MCYNIPQEEEMGNIITSELLVITPELAREFLSYNYSNRPINKLIVKKYAKAMKNGDWKLTHQGIAFDERGHLIDGQHRLFAIIEAEVNIPMLKLVYDSTVESLQYPIDIGKTRTIADITGLSRQHLAILNLFLNLFRLSQEPLYYTVLYSHLEPYFNKLHEIAGISIVKPSVRLEGSYPLMIIWDAPLKAALIALLVDNYDISVIEDLKQPNQQFEYIGELYDILVSDKDTRQFIKVDKMCYIFACIRNKQCVNTDDLDIIDDTKKVIRKILYPFVQDIVDRRY
jgi:hypothetical protein